jgi:hypothetical protein
MTLENNSSMNYKLYPEELQEILIKLGPYFTRQQIFDWCLFYQIYFWRLIQAQKEFLKNPKKYLAKACKLINKIRFVYIWSAGSISKTKNGTWNIWIKPGEEKEDVHTFIHELIHICLYKLNAGKRHSERWIEYTTYKLMRLDEAFCRKLLLKYAGETQLWFPGFISNINEFIWPFIKPLHPWTKWELEKTGKIRVNTIFSYNY